jgi:hypothetical protein
MHRARDWMAYGTIGTLVVLTGCLSQSAGTQPAGQTGRFPWVGNTLGTSQSVPAPWSALQVDGSSVRYWGGRIDFGDGPFPSQITSQDIELLSRPVTFAMRVDGKAAELSGDAKPKIVTQSDSAVSSTTALSEQNWSVRCTHTVEFDGMVRIDAVLAAQKPIRVDSLSLQVPLRSEVAQYFRRFYTYDFDEEKVDRNDFATSAGSTRQGWEISFTPYVWVGSPEAGLEWFSESDEAWKPWGRPKALALQPGPKETVLEARMITQPLQLRAGQSWTVTFGLSPTPSRPPVPNWRSYRWGGRTDQPAPEVDTGTHKVFAVFWINEGDFALERPGFPQPLDPAAYRAARQQLRQQGILYLPYGSLFKMDTNIPEWAVYGDDWSGGRTRSPWKSRRGGSRPQSICVSSSTFRDFLVWTYVDATRQYDIDGLFFDFGAPGLNCINPKHPHGQLMQQGIYHTSLFALRDLYKRLYIANREVKPEFLIVIHGMLPAMCTSFVHGNVFGEGTQELFNKSNLALNAAEMQLADRKWYVPDYIDEWPIDWTLAHLSRDVGTFPILLPQIMKYNKQYYRAHKDEMDAYTRGMLALAAAADVHAIWTILADLPLMRQLSAAKAKFDPLTDDVAFHPFWKREVSVDPESPQVCPTLYTRADSALLIVSNLARDSATITVDPGLSKLGVSLRENKAVDAMTNQVLPLDAQGKVQVTVQGKDFIVVLIT